jgi:hypothetical protein
MADLFVSYAREDREGATALVSALSAAGWSVFYDEHLQTGSDWIKELERELKVARCLVILLSAAARDSTWVREEKLFADSIRLAIFPVRLDSSPLPLGFATLHAASLPNWKGDTNEPAFRGFVKKLERQCPPSKRPAASPTASPVTQPAAPSVATPATPPATSPTPSPAAPPTTAPDRSLPPTPVAQPPAVKKAPVRRYAKRGDDEARTPWWLRIFEIVGPVLLNSFLFLFVLGSIVKIPEEFSRPSDEFVFRVFGGTLMAIGASVWLFRRTTRTLVRLLRFVFSSPAQRAYRRAEALRAEGRWEQAFEAYTSVLTRAPNHADALAGRALVSFEWNRPNDRFFEHDLDRALELGTTRHEVHGLMAKSVDAAGDDAKAIELYTLAKRACKPRWWQPREPGWRATYRTYCSEKANCHMALRQYKEALDELSEAIVYSWEDGELHRRRSFVYQMLGDRAAAARDDERATKLGWPSPASLRSRSRYR